MIDWEHKLRAAGGRITPQCRLIVSILQEQGGLLSADEIHLLARRRHSRLALATVYRTLQRLKGSGLVRELRLNGDGCRYAIERSEMHQWMVCLGCDQVIEVACAPCLEVHHDLAHQHDFEITGVDVKLLGYCADCRMHTQSHQTTSLCTWN